MDGKKKKAFLLYHDYRDTLFKLLSKTEIGQLISAILDYDIDGIIATFEDRTLQMAFDRMKRDSDNDQTKYQERCSKNRNASRIRWDKQMHANGSKCMQMDDYAYTKCQNENQNKLKTNTTTNIKAGGSKLEELHKYFGDDSND